MRIQGLTSRLAPWSARPIYAMWKRVFGKVPTPYTVLAHRPPILWTSFLMSLVHHQSRVVERRLKVLVSLRAAQMIGYPF